MNRSALSFAERRVRANQRPVRQASAVGRLQNLNEAVGIATLASVEPEHLLVNIGVKVEGSRSDIRSVQRPLQAAPKVLDGVGMDAAFAVGNGVVNKAVRVVGKTATGEQCVGIDRGAREHARANMGYQLRPLVVREVYHLDNCRVTLLPRNRLPSERVTSR